MMERNYKKNEVLAMKIKEPSRNILKKKSHKIPSQSQIQCPERTKLRGWSPLPDGKL